MTSYFDPLPKTQLEEKPRGLARPIDTRSQLRKGIDRGLPRLEGGLRGAVAAGATLLGFDKFGQEQARIAAETMAPRPEDAGRVTDINDVSTFADLSDYLEYGLGSSLPSMAAGAVTGGVAGIARGAGAAALTAGAVSGAEQGGALFAEETQRLPNEDPRKIAAATAAAGVGMGALDTLPVIRAFDRLGAGKMGRRIVNTAFKSGVEEAGTETGQTLIERSTRKFLDDNYDVFDEEGRNELLNAAAMGGLIGGGLGGASGVLPSSPFRDRVDDLEAEDEVRRLRVGRAADALRELDPEAGPLVDGLVAADDFDGLENLIVSRSSLLPPENRPINNTDDGFSDVKRRATLVLEDFRKARLARARAQANAANALEEAGVDGFANRTAEQNAANAARRTRKRIFDQGGSLADMQRDAEIADLLGEYVDDSEQGALEVGESTDEIDGLFDDEGSDRADFGRTANVRAFDDVTQYEPDTALGRAAYDSGYMADLDTGEVLSPDTVPSETLQRSNERDRPDLDTSVRGLGDRLVEQYDRLVKSGSSPHDLYEKIGFRNVDDWLRNQAEHLHNKLMSEEFAGRSEAHSIAKDKARAAKKKAPDAPPIGRREEFIDSAFRTMDSREFLNKFDATEQTALPDDMRSDPESVVLGGGESMVEFAKLRKTDLDRAWAQGKYKWAAALSDKTRGRTVKDGQTGEDKTVHPSRVIRMPTTLKRVYEQALEWGDIADATLPDIYEAFRYFEAEMLTRDRELSTSEDMIIAVQDGAPITLRKARMAAIDQRDLLREESFRDPLREAAARYRDSGSESDFLALEEAREKFDDFQAHRKQMREAARDAEHAIDPDQFVSDSIRDDTMQGGVRDIKTRDGKDVTAYGTRGATEAGDLANPEFASDEANRFRASYNAVAKRSKEQTKNRALAKKLLGVALEVYDAKSDDAVVDILSSELTESQLGRLSEAMGSLKPDAPLRAAVIDTLDAMAEQLLRQSADADMETRLTLRRDDEVDDLVPNREAGSSTKRTDKLLPNIPPTDNADRRQQFVREAMQKLKARGGLNTNSIAEVDYMNDQGVFWKLRSEFEVDRSTTMGVAEGRDAAPKVKRFEAKERQWLADVVRAFGIKRTVTFVSAEEIYGLTPSTVPAAVLSALRTEFLGGTNGAAIRIRKQAEMYVAVSPALTNQHARQAVLAHEVGHAVFKEFVRGQLTKDSLARAVQQEFLAWHAKVRGGKLDDALRSKLPKELLGLAEDAIDLDVDLASLTQAQMDYFLDFEEWFADNVSRWLKRTKTVAPDGAVAKFFHHAAELLRAIWGIFEEQDFKPASSVDTLLSGILYRAHGVYADRWVETLSGHVPYPKDVVAAVDQTLLAPYAQDVLNAALLQRLVPFTDHAIRQTRRAFDALLKPEERRVVGRVMSSWHVKKQILDYLAANHPALFNRAAADPTLSMAVGYQMWLQGTLNLGPDGTKLFDRLDSALDDAFGLVSQHQQAETVLTALQSGLLTLRRHNKAYFTLRSRTARDTVLKRAGQASLDAWKAISPVVEATLYPVQRRLLKTGVPELRQLAELMAPIAGQRREGEPYLIAKARRTAQLQGRYQEMTTGWNDDLKREIWDLLYDPERLKNAPASEAVTQAKKVQALFRQYHKYASPIIKLKFRNDYVPWVMNTKAIQDDAASFLHMLRLPKHQSEIDSIAKSWQMDPKYVPQRILDHILDQKGSTAVGNAPQTTQHSPYFGFSEVRVLDFLYENGTKAEREVLRSWLDQNLDHTVYMYAEQLVKRTEFTRLLGENGDQLTQLLKSAQANGASPGDVQLGHDFVAAMLGYHGRETNRALHRLFGKEAPDREVINPVLKNAMAGAMVMQNLAILGLATFTSLIDPVTVGVRTGDFTTAMKAYSAGAGEVWAAVKNQIPGRQKQKTRMNELAHSIGIIEERLVMESLSWQYSSTYLPHWLNAINEGFFKLIMLNQWTQLTRTMATAGGEQFLLAHRNGNETDSSLRYLEELGLRVGDVKEANGQLQMLEGAQRKTATPEELAADNRVRAALFQFVDESIIRPSPNTRALWMSDPHYMLIGHLKGFMFAFHEQILRRVWNEIGNKNFGPGIMLLSLIPAMLAANVLRGMVKGAATGEEPPDDPFFQAWWEAAQRAGLTGIFQVFFDAKRDVEYGGSPLSSALGPTWDNTITKLPEIMSGDESAIVDQLPLQNLFGSVYEEALPIE